jgi:hypothetical protein
MVDFKTVLEYICAGHFDAAGRAQEPHTMLQTDVFRPRASNLQLTSLPV